MPEQTQDEKQSNAENTVPQKISNDDTHINSGIINYIETHDRLFNVISSALIAIFTIILAISTIYLWRSTAVLEEFAKQQASDMKESIVAAKEAAKAASDANQLNRDNFLATEKHMKESIAAAKKAAKAASDANQLNRDNFLATERPWVTADIGVGGPLLYDVNGANFKLRFTLKNVGHSPATNVGISPQVIAPDIGGSSNFDPRAIQQEIINRLRKALPSSNPTGFTLFPGDVITQDIGVNIGMEELKRITKKVKFIMPTIIGTVHYSFVFEDSYHQTGFIIDVRRSSLSGPEDSAKSRRPNVIFPDEGDIPASELRFYRIGLFFGGEYAD